MTYRASVEFLENASPALIDRNAQEFRRLHNLIESTDASFGKAAGVDDLSRPARELYPLDKPADETSLGPMSIQVRRAAEVLGYDPAHLTDAQRDTVVESLRDPAQNIFIAAEYLAQLKAESGFADVPPERMTREQMQELAARYNGGPGYRNDAAQAYGRAFDSRLDQAKEALK